MKQPVVRFATRAEDDAVYAAHGLWPQLTTWHVSTLRFPVSQMPV
jgi:hypothetical protein